MKTLKASLNSDLVSQLRKLIDSEALIRRLNWASLESMVPLSVLYRHNVELLRLCMLLLHAYVFYSSVRYVQRESRITGIRVNSRPGAVFH